MIQWDKITNPNTGRKVSIKSKKGLEIIYNYLEQFGGGDKQSISNSFNKAGFKSIASSTDCDNFTNCCLPYLKLFIQEIGSSARGIELLKIKNSIKDGDIRLYSKKIKAEKDLYNLRAPLWIEYSKNIHNFNIIETYYKQIQLVKLCLKNFPKETQKTIRSNSITQLQGYYPEINYKYTDSGANTLSDFLRYYDVLFEEILKLGYQKISELLNNVSDKSYNEMLNQHSHLGWKHFVNQLYQHKKFINSAKTYLFRNNTILSVN